MVADNGAKSLPTRLVWGLRIAVFAVILVAVLFGAMALLSGLFGVMFT